MATTVRTRSRQDCVLKKRGFLEKTITRPLSLCALLAGLSLAEATTPGSRIEPAAQVATYPDDRTPAKWRLASQDQGMVLRKTRL